MNNAILIELAKRWENTALYETEQNVTESLRMCADALRMLVDLDPRAEARKSQSQNNLDLAKLPEKRE